MDQEKLLQDHKQEIMLTSIGEQVVHCLGKLTPQQRIQVRLLWGGFFRVNLIQVDEVGSIKIASSFFLRTDDDGKIIESMPAMPARNGGPPSC